jgi:hypothetical protein
LLGQLPRYWLLEFLHLRFLFSETAASFLAMVGKEWVVCFDEVLRVLRFSLMNKEELGRDLLANARSFDM